VKCVRAHCRGAGSSRHPAIFPVVFGELVHANVAQSSAISRTVSLLLLRTIVLTLAVISSFLDVDGSTKVLPSLHRRNQSNTYVRPTASSPYACCNNWYVSVAVFQILKQNLQLRCSVLSNIVEIAMTNARVTSATYCSQLCKRSHLKLVSWVAKTCTNMSRLAANTSHPVNNHYSSNSDTFWTDLIYFNNILYIVNTPTYFNASASSTGSLVLLLC